MKILFVSNFFAPFVVGGAEIVAQRLCGEMLRRGHDVAVLAGRRPDQDLRPGYLDVERDLGFRVYRIVMQSLDPNHSAYWHEGALAFRSVLHHERPDVVHFHNTVGLGVNLLPVATEFGCATIVTLHDYWGICHKNTLMLDDGSLCMDHEQCHACLSHFMSNIEVARPIRLRRDYVSHCLEMADKLVSPSRALAEVYQAELTDKKVDVRSNGVELAMFADSSPRRQCRSDKIRFIFCGYLGEHKGLEVLLDAVRQMSRIDALAGRWHLSILGDGHLKEQVESTIDSLPGSPVDYLGKLPRSNLPGVLHNHDVLVLPSIWPENESVALLEAIATGMAQIATRTGGNTDLIEHEKTGLLVEAGNAPSLLKAMIRFVEDPALVERFGRRNKARRSKFSSTRAADGYEKDYRTLLNRKPDDLSKSAPLIICGSGWPDLASTTVVNSFSAMFATSRKPRFIPAEWASALHWKTATLYWHWTGDCDPASLRKAIDHGTSVIMSNAHKMASLEKLAPGSVYTYETTIQAAVLIDTICNGLHPDHAGANQHRNLLATVMKLRDQTDSFSLWSELDVH